ncbi:MAG: TlyA family RNA methyltransferase [Firmicutes bacterium]|nr:TlyA family RNA methyltransferase [Bacillota bacterium]
MKTRLDVLLVNEGLAESRTRAQGLIMAGIVYVDGHRVDKPGTAVLRDAQIEVRGNPIPYVSRGGLKLAKALEVFSVVVQGKSAVDVGASTGGFTDCLLQNGVTRVIAIDVGYGQLDWRLRQDPRVLVMERTNIRNVLPHDLPGPVDMATVDVAFISLIKILHGISALLVPDGEIIALIKPQFEARRDQIGKKGVVRDPDVHQEVVTRVLREAADINLGLLGLTFSPIAGPEGNLEFLAYWQKGVAPHIDDYAKLSRDIVNEAHLELGTGL